MPVTVSAESQWLYPDMPAGAGALSTTRSGGVSVGPYASMNLAVHVGDRPAAVAQNRRLLLDESGCSAIQWLTQVHGSRCILATHASATGAPEADAAWTEEPGLALAVLTADCVPVVLCALNGSAVAVAHAGWRGLVAGVLAATVDAMPVAPGALQAWIGPAIGPASYEVGEDVFHAARGVMAEAEAFFAAAAGSGKYQLDLAGFARQQLRQLGVRAVLGDDICCAADERFFSFRRDGVTGRMATLAWLDG